MVEDVFVRWVLGVGRLWGHCWGMIVSLPSYTLIFLLTWISWTPHESTLIFTA